MSTANDNKKAMRSATSTPKTDTAKEQPSGSKKGLERKDEKKPEASAKPDLHVAKNDKASNTKNK